MKKQFQRRYYGKYNTKTKLNDFNFIASLSDPISLDSHTCSSQENFLQHNIHKLNDQKSHKYNKENCECHNNERINFQQTFRPSNKFYYQNKYNNRKKNTYLTLKKTTGNNLKPIDLDVISTSSDSGDEDNSFNKNSTIAAKSTFYSTSDMTTSDSEIFRHPNIKNTKK